MKRLLTGVATIGMVWAGFSVIPGVAQDTGQFDAATLKKGLTDIGYEPKSLNSEPGKEKFEIVVRKTDFDVPVGVEISPSKRFVWFTAFLGTAPDASKEPASRFEALLKANGSIQPTSFYITSKGNLMIGIALENRAATNAVLRFAIDKLADDTVKNASLWNIK